MRTPFVAANWKMHKTAEEAVAYVERFCARRPGHAGVEIVVAPPFTAIHAVSAAAAGTTIGVAGQDLHWESHGAFTGEISAAMLRNAGADYVIIGHSERRHLFGESDAEVKNKIRAALTVGLTPIVCVGETLDERDGNRTLDVLDRQVGDGLSGFDAEEIQRLVVAYEPVWAIGTGRTATPDQAQDAHAHIRSRLAASFSADTGHHCRVIYGGSVKPSNASELSAQPDVDGALVGGAGLDPDSFGEIVAKSAPSTV